MFANPSDSGQPEEQLRAAFEQWLANVSGERRREELPALIADIMRGYRKPDKTGGFFEHRLEEFVRQWEENNKS